MERILKYQSKIKGRKKQFINFQEKRAEGTKAKNLRVIRKRHRKNI